MIIELFLLDFKKEFRYSSLRTFYDLFMKEFLPNSMVIKHFRDGKERRERIVEFENVLWSMSFERLEKTSLEGEIRNLIVRYGEMINDFNLSRKIEKEWDSWKEYLKKGKIKKSLFTPYSYPKKFEESGFRDILRVPLKRRNVVVILSPKDVKKGLNLEERIPCMSSFRLSFKKEKSVLTAVWRSLELWNMTLDLFLWTNLLFYLNDTDFYQIHFFVYHFHWVVKNKEVDNGRN